MAEEADILRTLWLVVFIASNLFEDNISTRDNLQNRKLV